MENIVIGKNLLEKSGRLINFNQFSKIAILTDKNIAKSWLTVVKKSFKKPIVVIIIKPGEKEKNIQTVIKIWRKLVEEAFDRKSLLINLGGGVVGDLGGFAASTFMRGIPFIQIPTTLLSQVDASVGGKTGINFSGLKNIIGVFNQPYKVIIDVDTLKTLPGQEFLSGFAEVIKHGLIADKKYFDFVTGKRPEEFTQEELIKIIKRSIEIKSNIVKKDEKEKGLRKILNFGHTIGHAIEALSLKTKNPLSHGEAIAIGMVAESRLANFIGLISTYEFEVIEKTIRKADLPIRVKNISPEKIIKIIKTDKKNQAGKVLWSLPKKIGEAVFNIEAPEDLIIQAIKYIQI
jgi:3-dehydroquinate synthase